jgi:hypothetical protein
MKDRYARFELFRETPNRAIVMTDLLQAGLPSVNRHETGHQTCIVGIATKYAAYFCFL